MFEGRMRTSPVVRQRSQLIGFIDFLKHSEHMATRMVSSRAHLQYVSNQQLPDRKRKLIRGWKGVSANSRCHAHEPIEVREVGAESCVKQPLPVKISRRYKIYQDGVKRRHQRRLEYAQANKQQDRYILPRVEQPTGRYSQIRSVQMHEFSTNDHMPPLRPQRKATARHNKRTSSKTEACYDDGTGLIGHHKQMNSRNSNPTQRSPRAPQERHSMVDILGKQQPRRRRNLKNIVYDIEPWGIDDDEQD